jgi:transcriptional regulator with PAS, ATPase and Fis domain
VSRKAFAPEVLAAFARYAWPGNVRELRNVVEAMVLTSAASADDCIGVDLLPRELFAHPGEPPKEATPGALYLGVEQLEYTSIGAAIRKYEGNLTQAAKALRIARSTLYLKMKKYSLELVRDEVRYGSR